jgi:hypothetical protein
VEKALIKELETMRDAASDAERKADVEAYEVLKQGNHQAYRQAQIQAAQHRGVCVGLNMAIEEIKKGGVTCG